MKKIAIIGSGISGMACAYFLKDRYDVTFYEKEDYAGGHTNTVTVKEDGRDIHIDTGFMVFNLETYPNLVRFFKELAIPVKPTRMSFSFQHCPTNLEYGSAKLSGIFAQKRNIFRPAFYRMLSDILRFNKEGHEVLDNPRFASWTIARYAAEKKLGNEFLEHYLLPMSAAVWSTDSSLMKNFPVLTLVRFFKNHGLLGVRTHLQWYTPDGGSRVYRDKVISFFKGHVRLNRGARQVKRVNGKVSVRDASGAEEIFDQAVLACHADQALAMLENPTLDEKRLLALFRYQKNHAILHTDETVMPKAKTAWASWNYRVQNTAQGPRATTVYWMNCLQQVSQNKDYFVSINDPGNINPAKILWQKEYEHPIYSLDSVQAQAELPRLNENGLLFYCGAYFRYGFHEDGFTAGLEAARKITGEAVWG